MPFTSAVKYIASIYPTVIEPIIQAHGDNSAQGAARSKRYWMPPVERNKEPEVPRNLIPGTKYTDLNCATVKPVKIPGTGQWAVVMEVCDAFEDIQIIGALNSRGKLEKTSKLVPVEDIVKQCLKIWTGSFASVPGSPFAGAPGIIEINNSCPTQEEYQKMLNMQTIYYENLFSQAESHDRQNDKRHLWFRSLMADSAKWLDRPRAWSSAVFAASEVPCPACGKLKPPNTAICSHCGTVVGALPPELAKLNPGKFIGQEVPKVEPAGASK